MQTLETGSGVSTLVFALGGASHIAVAPHSDETQEICKYATSIGIDLSKVSFADMPSEQYLPTIALQNLDIVLIDGKHAFPWPMIDWFYTADRLKVGGLMMVDDIQLRPVAVLCDFMRKDVQRWHLERTVERTSTFRKTGSPIWDVSWVEQPWTARWKRPFVQRAMGRVRRLLGH
jgi:hypothetical protein